MRLTALLIVVAYRTPFLRSDDADNLGHIDPTRTLCEQTAVARFGLGRAIVIMAAQSRDTTIRRPSHYHDHFLRILGYILDRALPQFPVLAQHTFRACIRAGEDLLAPCRARGRWARRSDRASWARRRARRLGVAPHRRRRSGHDPEAHGMAGRRGDVGRRDARCSGLALRRCGPFRKYALATAYIADLT